MNQEILEISDQPTEPVESPEVETIDTGESIPKWLPERLERAKRSAVQSVLDDLGFADMDSLRNTLVQQSETLTSVSAERDSLREQVQSAESARREALLEAAFRYEAGQYDFYDLAEARLLVDLGGVALDDTNNVQGMREAVTGLVEQRPHLLRRKPRLVTDANQRGTRRRIQPNSVGEMPQEQVAAIKQRFQLP